MLLTDISRPSPDAAPRVRRRPGRTRRLATTTPGRVRAGAVAVGVAACGLGLVIAVVFGSLSSGIRSIGSRDAPEVDASTGLFFSLNDMDAQVANVLLVGSDRAQDLAIYQQDRKTADHDLQQAAVVAGGDAPAQEALRSVLDGVGGYEALAADAILTDQQARSAPGRPSAASLGYYRQATDLMSTSILPQVSALTAPGQSDWAFNQYSAALTSVIAINTDAFSRAVQAGQAGTSGWTGVFPAAGVLVVVVLTVIGIRPRLAEYR